MAIAFDTSTEVTGLTGNSSTAYTVGATSNSMLLVFPVSTNSDAWTVTGVTYNGVSMTQVGSKVVNGTTFNAMYCFAIPIASPDGASHNIALTQSGAENHVLLASSYNGVAQSTPEANGNNATQNTSTWSASVTTLSDNAWVVGGFRSQGVSSCADGTNTTHRGTYLNGQDAIIEYSSNPKTPAGSVTLNVTGCGINVAWGNVGILVSLAPFVASASKSTLSMLGVG